MVSVCQENTVKLHHMPIDLKSMKRDVPNALQMGGLAETHCQRANYDAKESQRKVEGDGSMSVIFMNRRYEHVLSPVHLDYVSCVVVVVVGMSVTFFCYLFVIC